MVLQEEQPPCYGLMSMILVCSRLMMGVVNLEYDLVSVWWIWIAGEYLHEILCDFHTKKHVLLLFFKP